jgi:tetrahydromethanopterin S-methyltransferase subunit B
MNTVNQVDLKEALVRISILEEQVKKLDKVLNGLPGSILEAVAKAIHYSNREINEKIRRVEEMSNSRERVRS